LIVGGEEVGTTTINHYKIRVVVKHLQYELILINMFRDQCKPKFLRELQK